MPEPKLAAAALVLAVLWIAESWAPFFTQFSGGGLRSRLRHDARNIALGMANGLLLAVLFGGVFTLASSWAETRNIGLLRVVDWPAPLELAAALIAFDIWMYVWHRANHRVPFLWRFHRMHHSDTELDATTAFRFHTGEILFSACLRLPVLLALGMELWQLAIYEAVLLPVIILHHSNVRLPRFLDHGLLALVVTPAMHRVHHSRVQPETDSNYGSVLPWWDMVFRTFRLREDARTIRPGLHGYDAPEWQGLKGMLLTPFRPRASIERRAELSPPARTTSRVG
jgi:sterol desaturase/sphingolipid hydroxylase (fatty acid hydroxylase superfamily)